MPPGPISPERRQRWTKLKPSVKTIAVIGHQSWCRVVLRKPRVGHWCPQCGATVERVLTVPDYKAINEKPKMGRPKKGSKKETRF